MKLIKIEAKGFKSFADGITLNFDGGIVGIVGPNGSGKSNINDAIRWVLGEQSFKALRGDNMEDVIFAGSKTAEAQDKAEVTLTFDNSDYSLKQFDKTITISRVVERGKGNNLYFVNGEIARHKDIKDIAVESGMSKSSLAIISQGTISEIAQASPEERRKIFEEAAGTSKYKLRKEEALRKLEKTKEALDKVKTVVLELNKQLIPLEKQAKNAKTYLEKSKELKSVEVALIVEDLVLFTNKLDSISTSLNQTSEAREDLKSELEKIENELKVKNSYRSNFETELSKIDQKINSLNEKLQELEISQQKEEQRRELLISGQINASSSEKNEAMKQQLEALNSKIMHLNSLETKLTKDISEKKEVQSNLELEIGKLRVESTNTQAKYNKTKTQIEILLDYQKNKTNLFKGTKTILENASVFDGLVGTVTQLIEVDNEYVPAIEAVLQNALQHLVVTKSEVAVKAIEFLKKNNSGRATFIPLNKLQPKKIRENHLYVLPSLDGFIDIAENLVKIDPKYDILKNFLLGNIIVATDINAANKMSKVLENSYMIVTLDGDIIRVGGILSGGEKENSNNLLGLDNQLEVLKSLLPQLQNAVNEKNRALAELEQDKNIDFNLIQEYNRNLIKSKEQLFYLRDAFEKLKTQYESTTNKKIDLESTINYKDTIEELKYEKSNLFAEANAKREQNESLIKEISYLNTKKFDQEKQLRNFESTHSASENEKNKFEILISSLQKRLGEHYEMTLEIARQTHVLEIPIEEAREIVKTLQTEIKALGNINLDAIESYEEVNTRYNTLKSSEEELLNAHATIINAISEMDKIIISRMRSTVNLVNVEFNKVFQIMFGGGNAEIEYENPNDILESGIDIIAQPPGKSIKNLKLFSGGEKSLIAISLLFAILKAKPLPLCILDEVEAALDETNVIRFAEFLQQLKQTTQFIIITHRQGTMSRVDKLFGATMQKRGITTFFGVELEKAKELIKN
ncbi:AAA family ATPase [[Mycoplasma] mobile]|uniref:Chromosome partition protein Smc n=1 Tax=Mycoplasma mobile (strain ATCC 43663 / 163K / NCTC 11711) TaxID=267748 RepID=Q6KHN4_MYCM1|nr:AAA family ATPase [[Mycoplasma] mobile]AAT27896.1 segregation of chromosomes protein [Mycoplasma mobile 163K]